MNGNFSAFKNRERMSEQKKVVSKEKIFSKKTALVNSNSKTKLDINTNLSPDELNELKNQIRNEKKQKLKEYNFLFLLFFVFFFILILFFAIKMNII
jgi:uncharacterized membrane protein